MCESLLGQDRALASSGIGIPRYICARRNKKTWSYVFLLSISIYFGGTSVRHEEVVQEAWVETLMAQVERAMEQREVHGWINIILFFLTR